MKGRPTMIDISHGGGGSRGGRLELGNLEPLVQELIKAVRSVALTVNVPPMSAPDVVVNVPPAAVKIDCRPPELVMNQDSLVDAVRGLKMNMTVAAGAAPQVTNSVPVPDVKVQVPGQRMVVAFMSILFMMDIALRIKEVLHP